MSCLKCGRETDGEQMFCALCLEEMERYPVNPSTAVRIPRREPEEEPKKIQPKRKPAPSPSEQILRLKKKVGRLRMALAVMLLICGLLCFVVAQAVMELDFQRLLGQNYTAVETAGEAHTSSSRIP